MLLTLSLIRSADASCPTAVPDYDVCPSGCSHTPISAAVSAASAGDVICVSAGVYRDHIDLGPGDDLAIEAAGVVELVSDGASQLVHVFQGALTLRGVTLNGEGVAQCAMVEVIGASLTFEDATVTDCFGTLGSAIESQTGTDLTLLRTEVRNREPRSGGRTRHPSGPERTVLRGQPP